MLRKMMLWTTALASLAGGAWAEGTLVISPQRVVLNDKQPTEMLVAYNRTDKVKKYKLSLVDQVMQENGTVKPEPTFAYSALRKVRFMPQEITLQPGQRQVIRVMKTGAVSATAGDYHSHLMFDEMVTTEAEQAALEREQRGDVGKGLVLAVETLISVGLPVIVEVGQTQGSLRLQGARVLRQVSGTQPLPPKMEIEIQRLGNATGEGMLTVVPVGVSKSIISPMRARVYRERDWVKLQPVINLQDVPGGAAALSTLQLQAVLVPTGEKVPQVVPAKN